MPFLNNIFKKKNTIGKLQFPQELYQQIIKDNGKTHIVVGIENENQFPSPPFIGPISRAKRDNKMFFTKIFNGSLTLNTESLKLDNSKELHTPKFDLGQEDEIDYILNIYLTEKSWTLDYYDKKLKTNTILEFEQFLYYSGT